MRKKKRNKNHYFTKVHENAIVEYTKTECNIKRTELYVGYIQPAFHEMVEKITYTYKFTSLPNIDPLKEECKIWLTTILDKFNPNKGSKAFSYFSVVTKHWFIHKLKKNSAQTKREVSYDDLIKETIHEDLVTNEEGYVEKREYKEFWMSLMSEIDRWESADLKVNERKVIEAIKILLSNAEQIEIFNKKAVYLYLREITGLNTKQIVNNLNKLRQKYRIFKIKWDRGDYESINRI
tara:strand:- start:590 stop:1297 length:708 start_codon:yes stop_codon:yes gene_type:complete